MKISEFVEKLQEIEREFGWKAVMGIMLAVWLLAVWLIAYATMTPAEAANLKLTAQTDRPYEKLIFPPKGVDWGCGKGRPVTKTKSGAKFCPK